MNITDLFVRRPVLALVVSFLIIIAGVQAYFTLNVRQWPKSDNASITITTVYVGASPELVRGFITTPLEQAVAAADGIDYLQSQSSQGISTITARLKLNYDSNRALAEITSKVDQVRNLLPAEAQIPVIDIESADSQFAAAYLSFTSKVLQQNEITDYLVRAVQPRLSAIPGVQQAELLGARTFAMRIWLKPDRMAALNISPSQVATALSANNHLTALGQTKGNLMSVNLTADTDLRSADDFKQLVVRQQGGAIVRLEDIADVVLGAEDYDTEVHFSGETAVFMGIFPLPNANTLDVIDRVNAEMKSIVHDLPVGMEGKVAYDGTAYIHAAIGDVFHTLEVTLLIVVCVIFLFLGSLRSVIVPVVAIPISLIGGVFLMQIFGFTLNLMTLLAIVLSVGLVVDDAIVVVENVERHIALGETRLMAALHGARELVGPIIAMTITLAAVYAPIGLQGGLTGSLFREFAFTLAGTVCISGIVALTLSPMMCGQLLRAGDDERGFAGVVNHAFARIRTTYGNVLAIILDCRRYVYVVWIILGVVGLFMISHAPTELAPTEDQGVIFGFGLTPAASTLDQLRPSAAQIDHVFRSIPETDFTFQITSPTFFIAGMVVKPWSERHRNIFQINQQVAPQIMAIPDVQLFATPPPAIPGADNYPVEFVISSTGDYDELLPLAKKLSADAMKARQFYFPPIVDVHIDQPQSEVVIDRNKAAMLGVNLQQVGNDLATAMGGNYINFFDISGRSYKVIPQVKRDQRLNPDQLKHIYVTGPNGTLVSLDTIATVKDSVVARSLNRFQQLNSVVLQGIPSQGVGAALDFLDKDAAQILPKGVRVDYMGESRQLRREGGSGQFWQMMGLALILIFLVLAAQFNSFTDPFIIIMGSVPLALFGAGIFMFLRMPNPNIPYWTNAFTTTFNIFSKVGLVTLVGLIAKNGILIVEFANKLQLTGKNKLEAIHEASMTRLRPVLMTSLATICGHLPLTWVTGPGAAARNSIGRVLVGGMTIGTVFTLFVVPCVYMLVARDHSKDKAREAAFEEPRQDSLQPAEA
ncbi:MAG TPA: efflux RND transporter permease subunit [Opitutaceae bacterium]|jgi:multidrug efflux pump